MRGSIRGLLILTATVAVLTGSYFPISAYLRERNQPIFRYQNVVRGDLIQNVNATGTVEPVQRVTVGSTASGPITEILVDFNDRVKKDQLLARIDPRIYQPVVERDEALMQTRAAEVLRAEAKLQQARNDERRALELQKRSTDFISATEVDQLKFNRMVQEAELSVAKTAVEQARANLDNSRANLEYTEIRSPVDGIIIDRKVDVGQTIAAQFQTPELFIVAPRMEEQMHIYAAVDEADIGLIRTARDTDQPVRFSIDAYADRVFDEGKILQIRLSSTEKQNVITYPVIVASPNKDLSLLPGMTANLSFQILEKKNVLKIPNAALRFYPPKREWVHPDDRAILDGIEELNSAQSSQSNQTQNRSAAERAEVAKQRTLRHVWIARDGLLRAVPVTTGISDNRTTELVSGDLKENDPLVVAEMPKQ
ncbi:MAG: efflux RND transporter periplasmic adaptor subunit [Pirellulaceae bacterium]|nr:efflux RND transporter periplasmic adaptor subunit [Pirellulaceae bacterium]